MKICILQRLRRIAAGRLSFGIVMCDGYVLLGAVRPELLNLLCSVSTCQVSKHPQVAKLYLNTWVLSSILAILRENLGSFDA